MSSAVISGRMREINLDGTWFRIISRAGSSITCVFEPRHEDTVKAALDRTVTVTGEAIESESSGDVTRVQVQELEVTDDPEDELDEPATLVPGNGAHFLKVLTEAGVVGMWADRTDIADSSEYARQLREEAQTRYFKSP